ncbi:MAG: Ca-activated chloride channel [Blastocatellia bacterium]|nr:Ca-activated chloride channel [Blastocatellia bacterium]
MGAVERANDRPFTAETLIGTIPTTTITSSLSRRGVTFLSILVELNYRRWEGNPLMKKNIVGAFRSCLVVVLFVVISSPGQDQNPPQQLAEDDVVRVSTTLVTVPVSVMDRQGRFIPDLTKEKFHIYEDGIEQKIAYFDNAEKPFAVALMLDTSDSTRFKLKDIQDAALEFIDQLRPDDRVIVAAFDKNTAVLAEATSDRSVLTSAIRRVNTGGSTGLYNAIDVIINQRLNRIRGRKAIVLFTDGVDTASQVATYEGTLRFAQELDSLIYPIQYDTLEDLRKQAVEMNAQIVTAKGETLGVAYARAERYLRQMADKTGGRFYYAGNLKTLRDVFKRIAQELREQYSIGYYPKSEGQSIERRIKVKVEVPGAVIKARRGYMYKAPTSRLPRVNQAGQ